MKVLWDSRFYKVSFFVYIKLHYQQNSVSTVIVNLEFARVALIAGEIRKNKFFSLTGCKTLILSIFEKNFFNTSQNKSVVRYRFKSKLQGSTVCLFSVIETSLFFLQVCKALFVTLEEMYTKWLTYVERQNV